MGNGNRMQFLTSDADNVVAFPGQVVQAIGRTENNRFHANKFYSGVPVPHRQREDNSSLDPVHIVAASGPFSMANDLDFSPLTYLLEHVLRTQPQICLLTGPFLDSTNTLIQGGGIVSEETGEGMDFVDVAEAVMFPILNDFLSKTRSNSVCQTQLVIVPSSDEAGFFFPTPQPSYTSSIFCEGWTELERAGAMLVENPCFLRVNKSFSVSCASQDPLSPLIRSVFLRPDPKGPERLEEIMRLLLTQRSWYPRDGTDRLNNMEMQVDHTQRKLFEFIRRRKKPMPAVAARIAVKPARYDMFGNIEEDADLGDVNMDGKTEAAKKDEERNLESDEFSIIEEKIPDLLLVSANIGQGYTAKLVEGRLFVNIGSVCRGTRTGTFAEIFVYPGEDSLGRVEIKALPQT